MHSFYLLLQNESMKIFFRLRTWILIGFVAVINFVMALIMNNVNEGTNVVSNLWDFSLSSVDLLWAAQVFTVIVAGDIVASEFSWGTIKLLLIRPATHARILLSKYIAVLFFAGTLMVTLLISSLLFGVLFFGMQTNSQESLFMLGKIASLYCVRLIELVMMLTFAFMLSAVFRSSSLAIGFSIFLIFTGKPMVDILHHFHYDWGKYLLFANMDLSQYFNNGEPLFNGMTFWFSISVILAHFFFFQLLAWVTFIKRDVSV